MDTHARRPPLTNIIGDPSACLPITYKYLWKFWTNYRRKAQTAAATMKNQLFYAFLKGFWGSRR